MRNQHSRELRDQLIESARRMRSNPTEAELRLWRILRKQQLGGFKFRRQHITETFIVDFYCPTAKLVIEVDGDVHLSQVEYDAERTKALNELGYRVLRFGNNEIDQRLESVVERIEKALKN